MKILSVDLMLRDKPTFKESCGLVRYIDLEFRNRNNRPATGAYQRKQNEDHLSVNSDEVETINQIAQTYATQFESGIRPVAVACPKVAEYNEAAIRVGITISFNTATKNWEFKDGGAPTEAYSHRKKQDNKSHCGVEYVRVFDDRDDFRYAVRLARSVTYRMI